MMTSPTNPAVSVIMPAYNAERFVEEAVRSVMGQSFTDWELLVIDDGSSDNTCAIVERLCLEDERIRFIKNAGNMGVAKTRNRGFDMSRGRYVAFLDSDDIWRADKLQKQLARIGEAEADLVYSSYSIIGSDGNSVKPDYMVPESIDFDGLLRENVIGCSTVMMSRNITREHRFTTEFYHEDYVLWLDLLEAGYKAVGCTEVLVDWRFIADSRSFDKRKSAGNRWHIYRDHLKLPLWKSLSAFADYAVSGIRKHYRK